MATYPLTVYGIREHRPGPRWRGLFARPGRLDQPAFAPAACSQVTIVHPTLLPNYGYRPDLLEQVSLSSDYLQAVIGTGDCP